jgi:hypothetical protein
MNNPISRVYHVYLDANEINLDTQKRIFTYGSRVRDASLLARLAGHPSLTAEMDARIRDIDLAEVKAAWAARPGRQTADLVKLVEKEKRVKVLTSLAERDDLPDELYNQLAVKSTGQSALFAIASNVNAPQQARHKATARLAAMFIPGEVSGGAETRKVAEVTKLLGNSPELADIVVRNTENHGAIGACVAATGLSPASQRHIARIAKKLAASTIERFTRQESRRYYSWYGQNWIPSIAEALADHGDIDKQAGDELIAMLEELDTAANSPTPSNATGNQPSSSRHHSEFKNAADKLREAMGKTRVDLLSLASSASTPAEIATVITELEKRNGGYNRFSRSAAVVVALVNNPVTSLNEISELVARYLNWQNRNLFANLTSDPDRVAVVASRMVYWDVDAILERSSDPQASFATLLTMVSDGRRFPLELLQSKYFSVDLIGKLPLDILSNEETPVNVAQMIASYLDTSISDAETWATLETLGREFEGSIEDLVRMVSSV